jgi:hypothetical protein
MSIEIEDLVDAEANGSGRRARDHPRSNGADCSLARVDDAHANRDVSTAYLVVYLVPNVYYKI